MNEATQTGVAMAAMGMIGTIVGLIVGFLKDRDKLRFDSDLAALKTQNTTQAAQIADNTKKLQDCEEKHRDCEEKHVSMVERMVEIERSLAGKKDETSDHKPLGGK